MNQPAQSIANLLARKIARQILTQEEDVLLNAWAAKSPANRQLYNELLNDQLLGNNLVDLCCIDRDARCNKLLASVHAGKKNTYRLIIAGAIITCLSAVVWMWRMGGLVATRKPDATKQSFAADSSVTLVTQQGTSYNLERAPGLLSGTNATVHYPCKICFNPEAAAGFNRVTTSPLKQAIITFADGSRAQLYKRSSLRFPGTFAGETERAVELTGLGYFDVKPYGNTPFTVLGGKDNVTQVSITAMDSKFLVYAMDAHAIGVTVIQGKVKVGNDKAETPLVAGYTGRLDLQTNILQQFRADTIAALQWTDEFASFDKIPVKAFLDTLSRYFNVEFRYDSVTRTDKTAYIYIRRNDSVEDVLGALQRTGTLSFSKINNISYAINLKTNRY